MPGRHLRRRLHRTSGELAAACYAREARVTRNTAWSQLVTIDIIRRDTLAARHKVGTPLSRLIAVYADSGCDGQSPSRPSLTATRPRLRPAAPAWMTPGRLTQPD